MDNLKVGLKVLALFLLGFFGVIASSGALNFGTTTHQGLYILAGALNFGIVGWAGYSLYKVLFKKEK